MWQFLSLGNSNLIWCDQICLSNGKSSSNRRFERPFLSDFLYDIQAKNPQAPIHSPLTIAYVNVIEWCLICWLFTLFAKVSFAFFFLLSMSEFFVPHSTIYDDVFWTLLLFTSQNIVFVPYWSMSAKKRVFAKNRKQMCEPLLLLQKWCHIEVLPHNDQKTEKFRKNGENCRFFAWMSYKNSDKKGLSNYRLLQLLLLGKEIKSHCLKFRFFRNRVQLNIMIF